MNGIEKKLLNTESIEKAFAITESLAAGGILKMQHALKTGLFHSLDVNKDGVIQFREFLPFYKSVYSQLKNIKGK